MTRSKAVRPILLVIGLIAAGSCGGGGTAADRDDGVPDNASTGAVAVADEAPPSAPDVGSPEADVPDTLPLILDERILPGDGPLGADGTVTGDAPREIVAELVARVSRESGISVDDVVVIRAFSKVWSDGSLGCGEPGIVYQPLPVTGHQVELEAAGERWDFRVDDAGAAIRCRPW